MKPPLQVDPPAQPVDAAGYRGSKSDSGVPTNVWKLLLLVAGLRIAEGLALGFRPFDDTFITLRYAKNLLAGFGLVFNPGEQVLGTTAPLWAFVTAFVALSGASLENVSFVLALLADAAAFLLMASLLWRFQPRLSVLVVFSCIFLAFSDLLSIVRSGMESSFFSMLALGSTLAVVRSRPGTAVLLGSLATLTRPEGVLILAMLALWGFAKSGESVPARAWILGLTPLLVWVAFATLEYGSCIPQSITAKAGHLAADPSLRRFSWMNLALFLVVGQIGGGELTRTWIQANWLISGLATLAVLASLRTPREKWPGRPTELALALGFIPVAFLGGYALAGAFTWFPWYYELPTRYGIAWASLGVVWLCNCLPKTLFGIRSMVAVTVTALIVSLQLVAAVRVKWRAPKDPVVESYLRLSATLAASPPGELAALEVGALGWGVWPRPTIDLLGLVTRKDLTGMTPLARLDQVQPTFLAVRVNDAAALLAAARERPWFATGYSVCSSFVPDSGGERFELYCRNSVARVNRADAPDR